MRLYQLGPENCDEKFGRTMYCEWEEGRGRQQGALATIKRLGWQDQVSPGRVGRPKPKSMARGRATTNEAEASHVSPPSTKDK